MQNPLTCEASNGEPDDPKALHFISEDSPVLNPYVVAIKSVGEVLAPYDSDKLYPVRRKKFQLKLDSSFKIVCV